jgi:hypothetical protein
MLDIQIFYTLEVLFLHLNDFYTEFNPVLDLS